MSARASAGFAGQRSIYRRLCDILGQDRWGRHDQGSTQRPQQSQIDCVVCHEPIYDAHDMKGTLSQESKCLECHEDNKRKASADSVILIRFARLPIGGLHRR